MAKSVDYLAMENGSYIPPRPKHPNFQRTRSFREIQGIISKMNPEVVKSVIQNGSSSTNNKSFVSDFPLCDYTLRLSCGGDEKNGVKYSTSPLTIFYNGTVSVFHVSPQKAEDILKFGEQAIHNSEINSHGQQYQYLTQSLNDLPITRRISLQRFLEKRRERLIMLSPYYFPTNNSNFNSSRKR
ncbi:hypothetical protein ABFS82_11G077800 [Erythranthe guttata]|uniref:protein TIFY 9 n=1 Tax=Erythranthe guttata TaxID=4155 RepID=UPI00064D9EDE|nr:PREDICTED: protein TIFY 9 [Erythranthe guttata]XP_012837515.1 PREDICTED: protein TIFY 9 [Erythranthe guttata]|eukprot:XP_012837514.1 PREDICTED: protein TIFY 9 [Erythranthe guttata]